MLLTCSQDWTCNLQMIVYLEALGTNAYNRYSTCPAGQFRMNFDKHLKKAGGLIGRNVVNIAIKMKTVVRKSWTIKFIKLRLKNSDNKEYTRRHKCHTYRDFTSKLEGRHQSQNLLGVGVNSKEKKYIQIYKVWYKGFLSL